MNKILPWLSDTNKSRSTIILWIIALLVVIVFMKSVVPLEQFDQEGKSFISIFIDNYIWFIILIYCVFLWGIYEATKIAADVDNEQNEAMLFKNEFQSMSNDLKRHKITMPQVESKIGGDNLRIFALYQNIFEAAQNQRFESPYFAIQRYSDAFVEEASKLNNIQRLSLQMGILGTFLGLITAFVEMYGQKDVKIDAILSALSFSFGTSVAGLECAIFLGIFTTIILRNKHAALFESMANSANNLLYLCHEIQKKEGKAFDVIELAETVKMQSERVNTQNSHLESLNISMIGGLETLTQSKRNLDEFIKKAVEDLTSIYHHFSSERLSQTIEKNMSSVSSNITSKLNGHFDEVSSNFKNLGDLDNNIAKMNKQLEVILKENNELVSESKTEIFHTLNEITKQLEIVAGNSISEELQNSIEKVGKEMITKNSEEVKLLRAELTALKTQLSLFNQSFNAEVESRKPVKILLEIGNLSVQFLKSVIIGIFSLINKIFRALSNK